jgi:hypothetical protein
MLTGLTMLLLQTALFAQGAAGDSGRNVSYHYLEEIFAKVSEPDSATAIFYEALEKITKPSQGKASWNLRWSRN